MVKMYSSVYLFFIAFCGFFCLQQVFKVTAIEVVKPSKLQGLLQYKISPNPKRSLTSTGWTQPKTLLTPSFKINDGVRKVQRRDLPLQTPFLGLPITIENAEEFGLKVDQPENVQLQEPPPPSPPPQEEQQSQLPTIPKLPPINKPLVKPNETEAERAERIHKSFERLLTFVEIVGQVDNYVSSKWKNLVRTVSNFYEVEDEPYRVSAKRIYGTCPHAH